MSKQILVAAVAALLAYGFGAAPALASGDFGPTKVYALLPDDVDNTVPFLSPYNDTRANLILMLADAGLAHVHAPLNADPTAPSDPYAAQTPLDLDTLAAVYSDKPAGSDDSSTFVDGEGDRCRSNAAGSDGFLSALAASKTPKAEQAVLVAARNALGSACNDKALDAVKLPAGAIKSAQGKEFAAYLTAAAQFYAGDFVGARPGFAGLINSAQPWLKETARYMMARDDLNGAQAKAFGDYGEMTAGNVDQGALTKADAEFRTYLHDYPKGVYAASARGLLRRVAWLAGDHTRLADEFGQAFAQTDPALRNVSAVDLAYEADNKLLTDAKPGEIHEARLLATQDLMRMRHTLSQPSDLSRADLEAQRPLFATQKALYDYLLAAYAFYVENNPAAALKVLGTTAPAAHMSNVDYSRQALKGLALEASKNPSAARAQWLALVAVAEPVLQRSSAELALAQNYERAGELAAVFASGSQVRNPTYRDRLLTWSAGPDLLRQQAKAGTATPHERALAAYTLLFKEITRGRYQAFLDDLPLMPAEAPSGADEGIPGLGNLAWAGQSEADGFACPSLKAIATALARKPHDERSLICMGEFLRANNDDNVLRNEPPSPPDPNIVPGPVELATLPSQFPGVGVSRLDIYKTIIADAKAEPDVRAYALYRAVNCWAPSGYNSCDSTDVPKSQRKAWFNMLKTQYRTTQWAADLKYYW